MELSCHQQSYSFTSTATSDIFLILHFPAPVISSEIRTGPWWEAVRGTLALWIPLEVQHDISKAEINEQFQQFVIYIKRVFGARSWPSAGPFKRVDVLTWVWHAGWHTGEEITCPALETKPSTDPLVAAGNPPASYLMVTVWALAWKAGKAAQGQEQNMKRPFKITFMCRVTGSDIKMLWDSSQRS